jgi:hypothetical protein
MSEAHPKIRFIDFAGYWRESEISSIPNSSGVYCVYACTFNPSSVSNGTLSIRFLIYIGAAEDVCDSITKTEKWPDWRKHLREGEELCFNIAAVEPSERALVEAALVFHNKPPENLEHMESYPFETTTVINTSGRNYLLSNQYIVQKTLPEPSEAPDTEPPAEKY